MTNIALRYIVPIHEADGGHLGSAGTDRAEPRSGYDVKRIIDKTIRHFWAASYGQLYPELRRLEEEGLIAGEAAPNGARARTLYRITDAGRQALDAWLHGIDTTVELRDESLLRLFFADALPRDHALGLLEARRLGHEQYLETLRAIDALPGEDPPFVDLVLRWGLAFHEWGAHWCAEQLERLEHVEAAP